MTVITQTRFNDDAWHHIAGTYDENWIRIYVDGNLEQEANATGSFEPISTVIIGARGNLAIPFIGSIDEVRIWDRGLTQAEIQANMNRSLTGNESGLVGYWNFDALDGSGMVPDLTGNGNDGTLVGNAQLVASGAPITGQEKTVTLPGGAEMEFVWIEPGTFTMGSPDTEPGREADEGPQHEVTISRGFYMGKFEVTQEQWESVMGTTPWVGQDYYVPSNPNHPAVYISWHDVQQLVQVLNSMTVGSLYDLPTEAEWEYVCRAGTTTRWSFGDDESQLGDYAWYRDNAWDVGLQYAQPVGIKLPNPWGLYDMHGNADEWCQDWYGSYSSSDQTDPTGPEDGTTRIIQSGMFFNYARDLRSAARNHYSPDGRFRTLGARLMLQAAEVRSVVPDTTTLYDRSLQIPIRVSETSGGGIVAAELFVSYDGDLLTAAGVDAAETLLTEGWTIETNVIQGIDTSVDTLKIAMATDDDVLMGEGTLLFVDFEVADIRHPAYSALTLEHVLFNDGFPAALAEDGSVTLVGVDGTIESDPMEIIPRWAVDVTVTDADEDRDGLNPDAFAVAVTNGSQTETVTLEETGNSTGIFAGSIETAFSLSFTADDGIVQAKAGDTIEFCYGDSLDGDGITVERCATTEVIGGHDGQIRTTVVSQPGDKVRVRVIDADLSESVDVLVENPRTGEVESILLSQFASGDSHFYGRFFTDTQVGGVGDSTLAVAKGDTLVVTYADTLTALGGTAVLQDDDEVVDPFGDADGNGSVQAFDAAKVLYHRLAPFLSGLDSLSANVDSLAPFGEIDPYDASLILQKVVGLVERFEVQEPESANHPQPETRERPKAVPEERELTLRVHEGYVSVWVEDRGGIVSGELRIEGIAGEVAMGEELGDFLVASRERQNGLQVVFAGAQGVAGPGELLRIYSGVGPGSARLTRASFNGGRIGARVTESEGTVRPLAFALYANAPNPFNPETVIGYALPVSAEVELTIYDAVGQQVRVLESGVRESGVHEVVWDGRSDSGAQVSSGVYFYRLEARGKTGARRADALPPAGLRFRQMRRMILLK